jgi:phage shock protein PspC (stress-responsive transcriptional regulator)
MNNRPLRRSNNRIIAGVLAGLAGYFGWKTDIVRVVYVLLTIFSAGFPGVVAYLVLWILMPARQS